VTFLAPWALWVAGAVSAAVVALHILASKNPRVTPLPTTRFIPDVPLRATARAMRLSDVPLLLLRVAMVMLVGLAFARPEPTTGRRAVGRVVLVDRGRMVDRMEAIDSARAYYRQGDVLLVFDSAVYRPEGTRALDVVADERVSADPRGSISAGLSAAMRAASSLKGQADSVEIVLISLLATQELDRATSAIRAVWPGRITLVQLPWHSPPYRVQTSRGLSHAPSNDPVRAAVSFTAHPDTGSIRTDSIRIDRGSATSADTSWTQHGLTLIRWPAVLDSSGYARRSRTDTAGGVVAEDANGRAVVVAPFVRMVVPPPGTVVARWSDGSPAATERKMMNGCVRDVAIPLPTTGDLALRESTRRLVSVLTGPCEDDAPLTPASDSALAQLRGTGPLVATRALERRAAPPGHLATWLLAAAFVLLLIEPLLRRQRASA
jgi:hypothetical protein